MGYGFGIIDQYLIVSKKKYLITSCSSELSGLIFERLF